MSAARSTFPSLCSTAVRVSVQNNTRFCVLTLTYTYEGSQARALPTIEGSPDSAINSRKQAYKSQAEFLITVVTSSMWIGNNRGLSIERPETPLESQSSSRILFHNYQHTAGDQTSEIQTKKHNYKWEEKWQINTIIIQFYSGSWCYQKLSKIKDSLNGNEPNLLTIHERISIRFQDSRGWTMIGSKPKPRVR